MVLQILQRNSISVQLLVTIMRFSHDPECTLGLEYETSYLRKNQVDAPINIQPMFNTIFVRIKTFQIKFLMTGYLT